MSDDTFVIDISRFVEKAKGRMDLAVRKVALDLFARIVMRSPVGNPELWAANAEAALQRSQHNAVVDQITANLASDPRNLTAKGNLKRSVRSASNRRLSKSQLARLYPLQAGKGYVGGRARANWRVSVGAPDSSTTENVDPGGIETIEAAEAALSSFHAGPSIYITNSLPYIRRLEYEGWSKQAPAGMVRITAVEFGAVVAEQVAEVRGST